MDNICISTWNVEGKGSPQEVDNILLQSESKSEPPIPHIICVQQANLPSDKESQNYRWLCSGEFGSAVLISKTSSLKSESVEQVCEQICVAEVITDLGTIFKIISCYIPPSTDYVTRDLWPKLTEIIKTIPCNVIYVLAGDFNAEVGSGETFNVGIGKGRIGPKLHHKNSNENGIQLTKLSLNLHATIANTFGGASSNTPVHTYKDGEGKSQRSFIVVPGDRVAYPYKVLMQDSKLGWNPAYKSAVLSKSLIFAPYKNFAKMTSSQVVVSSWNIQGASPAAVDKTLSEHNLPVICVQDLFLTSDLDVETKNYTWFTSKKVWGKNVGILIKTSPDISLANFKAVSESLCVGDVTLNGNMIKVICCCLPPHSDTAKFQEVTEKLTNLVKDVPKETVYVIAGDFNTHVTYTTLDDVLVFSEGDENAKFLQQIMKEYNVELQYTSKKAVTQTSEKIMRNSSHILLSASCMLTYAQKQYVWWVPFFDHGIVIMNLLDVDIEEDDFYLAFPNKAPPQQEKPNWKVEHVDGFTYVTKTYCRMKKQVSVRTTEHQTFRYLSPEYVEKLKLEEKSDLPAEIVAKYENSPPPMEELVRLLGKSFTLFYGILQEGCLPKGCSGVLNASFEHLKRGTLLIECIDVLEEKTQNPVKRIIKFRWNGIVVHQQEGGKFTNYKAIMNKGQKDFIRNLGQHFFTVKAKASFYNNMMPPLCQDKTKLDELVRVMKRDDFPRKATVEDLKIFIDKFFSGDPYFELLFGPNFSDFLDPLKKFAVSKGFGVRCYKSTSNVQRRYDNLSIFIQRSPEELRKRFMRTRDHQDLRFQLLPPCGTDKDYFEWLDQWEEKTIPDEYFKPYEASEEDTEMIVDNDNSEGNVKSNIIKPIENHVKGNKRKVGFVHKKVRMTGKQLQCTIEKCVNLSTGSPTVMLPKVKRDWINSAREESDLPEEIVKKYCEDPIPIKELVRILGEDFILYYGVGRASSVVLQPMEILAESFESIGRGGIMAEYAVLSRRGIGFKRLVKFKWNGICIHREESVTTNYKTLSINGQLFLVNILGHHFSAVKAKVSYYNGLLPQCKEEEKLNEVLRVMKKSDFPPTAGIDDVKKFISEFFSQDTDVELVFGTEFSVSEYLEPIKKFASEKDLGYRWLKSTKDSPRLDSISVFIKRTPQEIHEKLKKLPEHQDLRFYLVPPCEFVNKSHYDWIKHCTAEMSVEEFKLMKDKEEETEKSFVTKLLKQKTLSPAKQVSTRRKRVDPYRTFLNSQPSKTVAQPRSRRRLGEDSRSQLSRSVRQERNRLPRDCYEENSYSQPSRAVRQERDRLLRDYYEENSHSQPSRAVKRSSLWEEMITNHDESSRYQPSRSDGYDLSQGIAGQGYNAEPVGRKRDWEQMDQYGDYSRSQPTRSDEYDSPQRFREQAYRQEPERYVPETKRARRPEANQSTTRMEKPRWDDIGPLVIIWPLNVRSDYDKDPRRVLEANFPTEVSLEPNNRVAVYVTLPLRRTRKDKKYCLCVGNGVHNATKQALDMIVKHSSIIKHTLNYLPPDGLVPNFIRYNIPCQVNPRTYIILNAADTGPLTADKIRELFESLKLSLNEDLFFNKDYYTHDMKLMLLDMAPKYGLKVRHFGNDSRLVDRYICVYKTKEKDAILEEVLKMRDFHPKYRLVTNKLPPRLGLNIF